VIDPTDGSVLSIESVVVAPPANTGFGGFFDGLAVRPKDGVLFATHGVASSEIFMRNPTTTQWERIGAARPALSDRAFLTAPEPGGALRLATGVAALATRRRRLRRGPGQIRASARAETGRTSDRPRHDRACIWLGGSPLRTDALGRAPARRRAGTLGGGSGGGERSVS